MKHPMMLDMQALSGEKQTDQGYILHNGLQSKAWPKRKSRSKIARESKKRINAN